MKSRIQMIQESIARRHQLMESLNTLMEEYNIRDNIFVYVPQGTRSEYVVKEATAGYFEIHDEYNTLDEAMVNFDPSIQGIRIINNEKFQTGLLKNSFMECDKEFKIIDLYRGNYTN